MCKVIYSVITCHSKSSSFSCAIYIGKGCSVSCKIFAGRHEDFCILYSMDAFFKLIYICLSSLCQQICYFFSYFSETICSMFACALLC